MNDVDHGTLDLNGNGSFTYTSSASYVGADTFRYRVDGGLLRLSNTATATINVTNDAPVARPDAYSAVADVEKSIAAPGVLGNDDDADGDMAIDVVQNLPTATSTRMTTAASATRPTTGSAGRTPGAIACRTVWPGRTP